MEKDFSKEFKKITETSHLPNIFEVILKTKAIFAEGEEIVDSIFIEREGFEIVDGFIQKYSSWQPAVLIIATNFGITVLEEGGTKLTEDLYGYKIKHFTYEKIGGLELNICLLSGQFIISTLTGMEIETTVEFNTAKYYKDFERFIEKIRRIIFKLKK